MTAEIRRLNDLEEFPELYLIADEEKLRLSKMFKENGVELFKKNDIESAFFQFSDALKLLVLLDGKDDAQQSAVKDVEKQKDELLAILYCNMAGCHLLRRNWDFAIQLCESALMIDSTNVKALYRRGSALMEVEEYERAQADFASALQLSPNNEAVKAKMNELAKRVKSVNAKYAQAMKKMFEQIL